MARISATALARKTHDGPPHLITERLKAAGILPVQGDAIFDTTDMCNIKETWEGINVEACIARLGLPVAKIGRVRYVSADSADIIDEEIEKARQASVPVVKLPPSGRFTLQDVADLAGVSKSVTQAARKAAGIEFVEGFQLNRAGATELLAFLRDKAFGRVSAKMLKVLA